MPSRIGANTAPKRRRSVRPTDVETGAYFRALRERAGLSPEKVARALSVSRASVIRWESGQQRLLFSWAVALIDLYSDCGGLDSPAWSGFGGPA